MLTNLNNSNWTLDHIGHAVWDIDKSLSVYLDLLQFKLLERETLAEQQVELAFIEKGDSIIELLSPLPKSTILKKFLDSRGEALHHVCYRVSSVNDELAVLEARGVKLIDKQARPGSRNTEIAFLHPNSTSGMLIELCSHLPD
jgi:methylmalonyl-CoA epimerase